MILLQGAIFIGMTIEDIIKFLLFILVPLIIIIRTIKHVYQASDTKLEIKDFFLIFLKNVLYAIVVIIIGFNLFVLTSVFM